MLVALDICNGGGYQKFLFSPKPRGVAGRAKGGNGLVSEGGRSNSLSLSEQRKQ